MHIEPAAPANRPLALRIDADLDWCILSWSDADACGIAFMETFDIDFSDDGLTKLSKGVGNRMKNQLAEKLAAAGLGDRVKLTFTENGYGVPVNFHFEGSAEDIAKAKEVLRLNE